MLKAELISKDGNVIAIVRQTNDWTHSLGAIISIVTSWNSDGEVYGEEFFASCSIKWDGCSHFNYYGQDLYQDKESDSYYHECGLNSYYEQFISKLFAFEVAKHYMKDVEHMDDDLYLDVDRINILDNFKIRYSEVDVENDYFYIECNESLKELY